jgi:hypothetical protein
MRVVKTVLARCPTVQAAPHLARDGPMARELPHGMKSNVRLKSARFGIAAADRADQVGCGGARGLRGVRSGRRSTRSLSNEIATGRPCVHSTGNQVAAGGGATPGPNMVQPSTQQFGR